MTLEHGFLQGEPSEGKGGAFLRAGERHSHTQTMLMSLVPGGHVDVAVEVGADEVVGRAVVVVAGLVVEAAVVVGAAVVRGAVVVEGAAVVVGIVAVVGVTGLELVGAVVTGTAASRTDGSSQRP